MILSITLQPTEGLFPLDLNVLFDLAPENIECLGETKVTLSLGGSNIKLINIAMKVKNKKAREGH